MDVQWGFSRHTAWIYAALTAGLIAVVLVSCANNNSSATPPETATAGVCEGTHLAGTVPMAVFSGGRGRTILVHTPVGYTDRFQLALVLNLHGSGSSATGEEAFSGMDTASDADDFIVAYPQGDITSGSGYDWNVPGEPLFGGTPVPNGSPDDEAFLLQAITDLTRRYCIDPHEVYVTGFSDGARMASQFACDDSGGVAAVAAVSGLRLPAPCPGTRAVPVIAFHGEADPVDPYDGNGQPYWTYSVPDAASKWAKHDSCSAQPASASPAGGVQLSIYTGCQNGAAVDLYSIAGAGHTWPGGPPLPPGLKAALGPESSAVDANALIWTFFQHYHLP